MMRRVLIGLAASLVMAAGGTIALAQGTAITYQGQLRNAGTAVNTPTDMQFSLFTAATGGTQVGSTVTVNAVAVSQGLFTTPIDFGVNPYTSNQALFLQIAVRNPAGTGAFVPMGARQALTPAPFSLATRGLSVDSANNARLAGNLGIGAPAESSIPLAIQGSFSDSIRLFNLNPDSSNGLTLLTSTGQIAGKIGYTNPGPGGVLADTLNIHGVRDVVFAPSPQFVAERMRIKADTGNVGIGTATPANTLTVSGNADFTGKVGIGVSAPIANLEIQGPVSGVNDPTALIRMFNCGDACAQEGFTEGLRLLNESSNGRMGLGFLLGPASTINTVPSVWIGTNNGSNPGDGSNDFVVATKTSATTLTPRMTVNGDTGEVGIGTQTPAARLHNIGTTRLDDDLQFGAQTFNGSTGRNVLLERRDLPSFSDLAVDLSAGSAGLTVSVNGQNGILLTANGFAFKPGGGTWGVLSDERTKTDVQSLSGTLDRLLKLKGHKYTYKTEYVESGKALPGTQIGLVAQEVEAVFPDWVTTGRDGLKVVTERSTTALMVEAMRDLRNEKDAQIAERDAKLAELNARMEKLEALLAVQAAGK